MFTIKLEHFCANPMQLITEIRKSGLPGVVLLNDIEKLEVKLQPQAAKELDQDNESSQ